MNHLKELIAFRKMGIMLFLIVPFVLTTGQTTSGKVQSGLLLSGNINKGILEAQTGIKEIVKQNYSPPSPFSVVSFEMLVVSNGEKRSESVLGEKLTSSMKTLIKNSKPGDKITFENVCIVAPDTPVRKLEAIVFYIT